jgi:hypothetical protein
MIKLYERDYFTVTPEELEQKAQIDAQRTPDRRIGHAISPCDYRKSIRHFNSLFPNNFLDFCDLQNRSQLNEKIEGFLKLINRLFTNEQQVLDWIKTNEAYPIIGSLLKRYSFGRDIGHHGAYLFREFPLGDQYRADYLLIGNSSDGHQFVLVELEHPHARTVIKKGYFGENTRKGDNQVRDWKEFIASHYDSFKKVLQEYAIRDLPDELELYDRTRFSYIVVCGRRSDFDRKTYLRARESLHDSGIRIIHYDNLVDSAREIIGEATY